MGPGFAKRKRPERQYSHEDGAGRPSPHRPENLGMAHRYDYDGGRPARGGRHGRYSGVAHDPPAASPAPQYQHQHQQKADTPATDVTRTSTPVVRTAAPTPRPAVEEPRGPPAPYAYEYVTDKVVASWQESGKQAIVATAGGADDVTMSAVLQELVRAGVEGRLDPTQSGAAVRQIIASTPQVEGMDTQSLFLDTISFLDESDTRKPALLALVAATDIDPEVIRQELDVPLLQTLSLVRSTFERMKARKTTNSLYRQANFNLLREETEGYAKLLTEYFNIVDASSGNQELESAVAEDAFQRIKALVGAFDLDVGRVLDITMDISANAVVRAYAFIIKFYRCSSWWRDDSILDNVQFAEPYVSPFPQWALPGSARSAYTEDERKQIEVVKESRDAHFWRRLQESGIEAFFDLGARPIVQFDSVAEFLNTEIEPTYDTKRQEVQPDKRKRINENRKYMRETKQLPPPGNADAAQLLGFKLRFYASSARDASDALPENLVHFAALLIKVGFISLRDLYPHLYPPDDQMPEERKRLEKEKAERDAKERPGGAPNALAMAGVLTDDTLPVGRSLRGDKERSGGNTPQPDKKDDSADDTLPPPENQKIWLLKALLALGALPEALFIIGRFPWLLEVDSSLPAYLFRIVKHMLSKMTDSLRRHPDRPSLGQARDQVASSSARPDGMLSRVPGPPKRSPVKWLQLEGLSKEGQEGRYYYTEWYDGVPVCQTLEDVFALCNSLLGFLGPKIGQDPVIYGTLIRLASRSLTEDTSDANRSRWLDLMKRLLVPASSFTKHNPGLTEELYQLLMMYPITTRYSIYAEWFTGRTSRLPDVKAAFDFNRAEVKEVMRRVSNDNVKTQSRALGKVSYSSPGVLIMFMINQLESYSNMIPALVECTKYFPKLAYDVLTWCLITSLSGTGRDRIQADGMLTSSWLQALSQFVASLFHRYSDVDPSPILQYLAHELRKGESTDLEMFEQVLAEMAGIRSDMEFNDQQVLAMAGGELLQAQVVQQLGDTRHTRKSSAKRLIKALAEPGLIGQTLISIAQERQMYPYHEASKFMPLKVLGNNLDKIQHVFAQYLEVLKTHLKYEDFEAAVPDVITLIGEFGLRSSLAFAICRAAIGHRMLEYDDAKKQEEQERKRSRSSQIKPQVNGDVEMQEAGNKPELNSEHNTDVETAVSETPLPNGDGQAPATAPLPPGAMNGDGSPWHPVLEPIIRQLPDVAPGLKNKVSIPFFVTFWTLAQSDVIVIMDCYQNEINGRLKGQVDNISKDRSVMSTTSSIQQRQRERKALEELQEKLRVEAKSRVAHYTVVSNRLSRREKQHWFDRSRDRGHLDARHAALLQECFLPRAMLSSLDAHYSFLMLKLIHEKGAPGFSTLHLMAQLFRKQELAAIIFQCTANEAQHLGRFLNEIIKLLAGWHAKREAYEKEALGTLGKTKLPGFVIGAVDYEDPSTWNFMDYETYRRQVYNWHTCLTGALQMCFESGEYGHIRNGIIVLKALAQNFPQLNFHGKSMITLVTKVSEEDSRQDLKLMALSLLGPLKGREKSWVMPQAFRLNDPAKDGKPGSRAPSTRPETPHNGDGSLKLNAAAPEFKPTLTTIANGTSKKESATGVEDGEVEEEVPVPAKGGDAETKDAPVPKDEVANESRATETATEKSLHGARTPEPRGAASKSPKDPPQPESKAPTPIPSAPRSQPPANGSARLDSSRPSSTQPSGPRYAHDLHSRPDHRPQPYANKPLARPSGARPEGRYNARNDDRYGRLDRPSDVRPVSREQSPGAHSRPRSPPPGARTPRDERPRITRDDSGAGPRRDPSSMAMPSRPSDTRDRANGPMGPPSAHSHPERPGYLASAVSASSPRPTSQLSSSGVQSTQSPADESSSFVNPERQRMMETQPSRDMPRTEKDSRWERDGRDDRNAPYASRTDTRDPRLYGRGPTENTREPPPRRDFPTDLAPSGPRSGRLSKDFGPPPESSYGRLNPPQDMPGARSVHGPGMRGGRNFTAPHASINTRANEPPAPSSSMSRPPESPAPFRPQPSRSTSDLRNPAPQFDRQPASSSRPTTPAGENGPNLHPSRMQNVHQQPHSIHTNVQPANGMRSAASPGSAPPSGPRGAGGRAPASTPTGPSPVTSQPPSAPAAQERERLRRDRQRASINAQMVQSTNGSGSGSRGPDVSFRGASSRQNSFQASSTPGPGPSVQALASPMEPPQSRRTDAVRQQQDAPHPRPGPRAETRGDLFQRNDDADTRNANRAWRGDDARLDERHRSGHMSGREPLPRPPMPGMDDGRDNRGGPRDERRLRDERGPPPREYRGPEREPRDGRRPPLDAPGPFSMASAPEWAGGGGDDGRGFRRDGGKPGSRPEDFRGGRREDERRDGGRGPPRDDMAPDARKRRHDGPSWDMDPNKRRRSGK